MLPKSATIIEACKVSSFEDIITNPLHLLEASGTWHCGDIVSGQSWLIELDLTLGGLHDMTLCNLFLLDWI